MSRRITGLLITLVAVFAFSLLTPAIPECYHPCENSCEGYPCYVGPWDNHYCLPYACPGGMDHYCEWFCTTYHDYEWPINYCDLFNSLTSDCRYGCD